MIIFMDSPLRHPASLIPVTAKNVDKYEKQFLNGCVLTPNEIRNLSRVYNPDADLPGFIENFLKRGISKIHILSLI